MRHACDRMLGVHGAGRGIERHVEEQRAAASRERSTASRRTFPLRPPGFVEVQMHVDARQHELPVASIFAAARDVGRYFANPSILDREVRALLTAGGDQGSAAYHDVAHACASARSSRNVSPTPRAAATSPSSTVSPG